VVKQNLRGNPKERLIKNLLRGNLKNDFFL